jgi:hypothetical protein
MKRGRILLGMVVLISIIAFLGSVQLGYGKTKSGAEQGAALSAKPSCKCACWKIGKMEVTSAKEKCYRVPAPGAGDFRFSFTIELVAGPITGPTTIPPCELIIDGSSRTCQYESSTKPPLNLTGVSGWITWDSTRVQVTRVSSHKIQLFFPEYYVSGKCDGTTPVTITLTAHSMSSKLCGGREMCKPNTKTLTVPPCK